MGVCPLSGETPSGETPPAEIAPPDEDIDEDPPQPQFTVEFSKADGTIGTVSAQVVIDASGVSTESQNDIWGNTKLQCCSKTGQFLGARSDFAIDRDQFAATENLVTNEPNLYVIGRKSFGNDERHGKYFSLRDGHDQIRALFSILGDRADLDLYSSIRPLE